MCKCLQMAALVMMMVTMTTWEEQEFKSEEVVGEVVGEVKQEEESELVAEEERKTLINIKGLEGTETVTVREQLWAARVLTGGEGRPRGWWRHRNPSCRAEQLSGEGCLEEGTGRLVLLWGELPAGRERDTDLAVTVVGTGSQDL